MVHGNASQQYGTLTYPSGTAHVKSVANNRNGMYPTDMSHLARWLSHNGETATALMKRTGLSWATIQRAVHETRRLDLATAIRLHVATRGEVSVADLTPHAGVLDELAAMRKPRRRSA